jgi:exodeoxyribonuclease-3
VDTLFPRDAFRSIGYAAAAVGQPGYNGVAVLVRGGTVDARIQPVWPRDPDSRAIGVTLGGVRVVNVYVPYGEAVGTARFEAKVRWLRRLERLMGETRPTVVTGDFNVAPDDRDVYDPRRRNETLICSTRERRAFGRLLKTGYVDAFRQKEDTGGHFTWWSHRSGAVEGNRGLRVDHHLVDKNLAQRIRKVEIDVDERRRPGASDHAPVTLTLRM